jgi:Hypothetical glycosyl hydrolase family 15
LRPVYVALAILCLIFFGAVVIFTVGWLLEDTPNVPVPPGTVKTNLAWFYRPPDDGNLDPLAKRFNLYILTHGDESQRESVREKGGTGLFLQYLHFETIQDPALCKDKRLCSGEPWGNQVAYRQGDFEAISDAHPDWFLRDTSGELIVMDGSFVMMDPGNSGWQAYFLERAQEMQEQFGWDGLFLDNVEASLDKIRRSGKVPARYPDDASYQTAVLGFLKRLYTGYFQPQKRPLYANIIEVHDLATWSKYLRFLDGVMDEAWATGWDGSYLSYDEWDQHLRRAERAQTLGKQVILVGQGERFDTSRQQFAFASYLLVNNGRAAFRYSHYDDGYEQVWLYGNYFQSLGDPMGRRICPLSLLCLREYSRAWVLVVPYFQYALISAR